MLNDVENTVNVKQIQDFALKCNAEILVGFPSGLMHTSIDRESGNEIVEETAELAKRLSFGDNLIPPRPFLEDGIESGKEDLLRAFKKQMENVHEGKKANWNQVGVMAVGKIQEFVRSGYYKANVPNAPETIEKKGSDTPLIDTAQMLNSTTFIVEAGGTK